MASCPPIKSERYELINSMPSQKSFRLQPQNSKKMQIPARVDFNEIVLQWEWPSEGAVFSGSDLRRGCQSVKVAFSGIGWMERSLGMAFSRIAHPRNDLRQEGSSVGLTISRSGIQREGPTVRVAVSGRGFP